MIKLNLKVEDFEGNTQETECCFHLNKMELSELNVKYANDGGLEGHLKKLTDNKDPEAIYEFVKELMILGFGIKSDDGQAFIKSQIVKDTFRYGYILPECMLKIMSDETGKDVFNFIKGMLPKSSQDIIDQNVQNDPRFAQYK